MGTRPGAGAVYLNIFHMDIKEFLDSKKVNAGEEIILNKLSLGLIVPNKFMELLKEGKEYYTFDTYDILQEYGKHIDEVDFSKEYDKLVANGNIRKEKLNPRDIMTDIAKTLLQSGYPYMFFIDNANDNHPLKQLGKVKMSNLCTEISQLQEISDIHPYLESSKDKIGRDVVCTLGSLNLVNVVEKGLLEDSVSIGFESLARVTQHMYIPSLPSVQKANDELRAVGIGSMNLAGLLAKNQISYGSKQALDLINSLYSAIMYQTLKNNNKLAKNYGSFKGFEKSEYANGNFFKQYINKSHEPTTKKAKEVLKNVYIPTQEDWKKLSKEVKETGLYSAYSKAEAPY